MDDRISKKQAGEKRLDQVQESAIIRNESGILEKRGGGFRFSSQFSKQNLLYVIWSDEFLVDTAYHVSRDYLEAYQIHYIRKGHLLYHLNGKEYHGREGDLIFMDMHLPSSYEALEKTNMYQLLFDGHAAGSYYHLISSQYGPVAHECKGGERLLKTLQVALNEEIINEHLVSITLFQILNEILVCQQHTPAKDPIINARRYIRAHYMEKISLDDIAEASGYSKFYFSRQFTRHLGYTPWEYLTSLRIRRAMKLLTETKESIEAISESCGFQSASHFINSFKHSTEMTPSKFRQYFTLTAMGDIAPRV